MGLQPGAPHPTPHWGELPQSPGPEAVALALETQVLDGSCAGSLDVLHMLKPQKASWG